MKGLLLKDFYMLKNLKAFILFMAIFLFVSTFSEENMFMLFYPCVLSGIIPVSLLGYDERSKWDKYSLTLPYTRAQIVSAKYLMGLFIQLTVLVFAGISQVVYMNNHGGFNGHNFLILISTLSALSFFTISIMRWHCSDFIPKQ